MYPPDIIFVLCSGRLYGIAYDLVLCQKWLHFMREKVFYSNVYQYIS